MKKTWIAALGSLAASAGMAWAETPSAPTAPVMATPTVAAPATAVWSDHDAAADASSFWFSADYLLWWIKKGPQNTPLVATGTLADAFPGVLDQAHTKVLFGGSGLDYDQFSGIRLNAGAWLNEDRTLGVEASGFWLEKRSVNFNLAGNANGQPFFGRPFNNALTGNENIYFVSQNLADPTRSAGMTGSLDIRSDTRLWGWEINAAANLCRSCSLSADLLVGFRSLGLKEDLQFTEGLRNVGAGCDSVIFAGSVSPPNSVATFDSFATENRFYGPQLGGRVEWCGGKFSVGVVAKVALGVSQELVSIDGSTALLNGSGAVVATQRGGVFATTSNSGRYFRDQFAVVPEVGLNLGYRVTDWLTVRVGYTFLYWSDVTRPGDAYDRNINPHLVPTDAAFGQPGGPARPAFAFHSSDFWAQGINFGIELRY